jgi:hypothetical protein
MKKNTTADQEAPTKPEVRRHALHIKAITVEISHSFFPLEFT